ncbi:hypothetical protein [Arthrobacter sp. NPDC056727]|uniref:hypothetical protein n=1 Tax=Arthrobacter sp. NPDC056727 TaxID=3345927 RepID=UPI0036705AA5
MIAHGQHLGSGVIAWMPDGSVFWIWLDHGAASAWYTEATPWMSWSLRPTRNPLPTRLTDGQRPDRTNSEPDPAKTPIQEPLAAVMDDEVPQDPEHHEANGLLNDLLRRLDAAIADVRATTSGTPHFVVEARLREELKRDMPSVTFPAADISGWEAGFSS